MERSGYEWITRQAMFAPPKTPGAMVNRLNKEIVGVLTNPEVKEKLLAAGTETTVGTPEEVTAMMKSEMAKMKKVIAGLSVK
jgi:tripartite-type tricarboxylate transporter receptor subunit TctC